jgi:hypothetical protein
MDSSVSGYGLSAACYENDNEVICSIKIEGLLYYEKHMIWGSLHNYKFRNRQISTAVSTFVYF